MPRRSLGSSSLLVLVLAATAGLVAADTNDWLNVDYVLQQSKADNTAGARLHIISKAGIYAKSGPWDIVTKNKGKPPSGDIHDYLSWAPYHWPDCNWCSKGTNHLSGPNQGDNSTDDSSGDDNGTPDGNDPYEDGGVDGSDPEDAYELLDIPHLAVQRKRDTSGLGPSHIHRRMMRRKRQLFGHSTFNIFVHRQDDSAAPQGAISESLVNGVPVPTYNGEPLPTQPPDVGKLPTAVPGSSSSSVRTINGTPAPAQAPAKTTKGSKCTPSPSKSLAPSATWTTCPYAVRDGKVNPDVRSLPDSPAAVDMAQGVMYNAIAFAMQNSETYSQNAAKFIDAFFLAPSTAMNPNMNFGQLVRGPGKAHQMGTFTGILDLRALVKVINAIKLLQAAGSPDWTSARDKAMTDWMKSYISWLENSAIGKETASKANNHFTFYVNQLAAAKMYAGDTQGAQAALKNYFANQYKDQIAASGEQPFEAVRTRPFHYRCFNLEAMITNAKLADQLGMNFWTAKSKYGATIQTALDYVMATNPKGEDIADIFPHVAAVAAAYGDPKGKYAAFLQEKNSGYTDEPFWFYDQSSALPNSPAGRAKRRRDLSFGVDKTTDSDQALGADMSAAEGMVTDAVDAVESGGVPFECPAVFDAAKQVELEDGLFVTCDELEPYYEIVLPY